MNYPAIFLWLSVTRISLSSIDFSSYNDTILTNKPSLIIIPVGFLTVCQVTQSLCLILSDTLQVALVNSNTHHTLNIHVHTHGCACTDTRMRAYITCIVSVSTLVLSSTTLYGNHHHQYYNNLHVHYFLVCLFLISRTTFLTCLTIERDGYLYFPMHVRTCTSDLILNNCVSQSLVFTFNLCSSFDNSFCNFLILTEKKRSYMPVAPPPGHVFDHKFKYCFRLNCQKTLNPDPLTNLCRFFFDSDT